MKIALVFSGQPRYIDSVTYESIKKELLDKYNCDVYAHFWFSSNKDTQYETAPWSSLGNITIPEDTIKKFINLYNPKNIEFEEPYSDSQLVQRNYARTSHPRTPYNLRSMYTSHKKAYALIPNPEEYDFIIRIRTDDYIYRLLDLNIISKDKNYAFIQDKSRGIINDSFIILNNKDAKHVFNGIDIIDTLHDDGILLNPEEIFKGILDYHNIFNNTELLSYDKMTIGFFRGNRHSPW